MEKKYTPGPWSITHTPRDMMIRAEQGPVALVHWGYVRGVDKLALADETVANAQLIAAAPELLEALEEMAAAFLDGNVAGIEEMSFAKKTRAAIAKAKGEPHA